MTRRFHSIAMAMASIALVACSHKPRPQTGSQTHFLRACDAACAAPYDCICGVCTLQCTKDAQCSDQASGATCAPAHGGDGRECSSGESVCDVTCGGDDDCSALGDGYACAVGRCRAVPAGIDAGSSANTDAGMHASDAATDHDSAVSVLDSGAHVDSGTIASDAGGGAALCDGSDDIRLGMWQSGGFVSNEWIFMHPFGASFAFIDGHCRFYASSDAMVGVASGTLGAAEADQLAREVGYAQLALFSRHLDESCPDAPASMISDGTHAFGCSCGCDADAPAGLADAEAAAGSWIGRLADEGSPLDGPVRAVATDYGGASTAGAQAWPLASPISDILVGDGSLVQADSGASFDDPADAAALRALRKKMLGSNPEAQQVLIDDGSQQYYLYVRDELPPDVDAATHAFETASYATKMQ